MEPSLSPDCVPEPPPALAAGDVAALFALVGRAVAAGLQGLPPESPVAAGLPPALSRPSGAFVTIEVAGELNGCIGTLEGVEPLGKAVVSLAWSAAFADPRLPALQAAEVHRATAKVSLLGPLAPVAAATEAALVHLLRPGIDGLLLDFGDRRATFLPAVWRQLADPRAFVGHLQLKAGLPPGVWPPGTRAWRYLAVEHSCRLAEVVPKIAPGAA